MPKYTSGSPRNSKTRFYKKWWFLGLLLLVVIFATLELTNVTHFLHKSVPATKVVVTAGNPTTKPVNNSSAGSSTQKTNDTSNSSRTIGGGNDTGGSSVANTPESQWVISKSGNITVKQPVANSKIASGATLSGSAKVDKVSFRLIDDKTGVIAQGTLSVVNGNFSGSLNFTPNSSTGRLDVFSTDAQGVELNEVQIAVSF